MANNPNINLSSAAAPTPAFQPGALHVDEVAQIITQQALAGDAPTEVDDHHDLAREPGDAPPGFPDVILVNGKQHKIRHCIIGADDIKGSRHRYLNCSIHGKTPAQPVTRDDKRFNSIPRSKFDNNGACRELGDYVYYIVASVKDEIDNRRKAAGPVAKLSKAMLRGRDQVSDGKRSIKTLHGEPVVTQEEKFKTHHTEGVPVGVATGDRGI